MDGSSDFPPEYLITSEAFPSSFMSVLPEDVDKLTPEIPVGEEQVEKFMQELYKEITTTTDAGTITFSEAPSGTAEGYSAKEPCLRWNEWERESCGAAVSDSGSTVMAGMEYAGKVVAVPESRGRCGCKFGSNGRLVVGGAGNGEGEGGEINGFGGCGAEEDRKTEGEDEDEEEWFARVLSWGPADLVPGFWNDVHCGGSS